VKRASGSTGCVKDTQKRERYTLLLRKTIGSCAGIFNASRYTPRKGNQSGNGTSETTYERGGPVGVTFELLVSTKKGEPKTSIKTDA